MSLEAYFNHESYFDIGILKYDESQNCLYFDVGYRLLKNLHVITSQHWVPPLSIFSNYLHYFLSFFARFF